MFYYNRNDEEYIMNKNSAEFEVRDSDKSKSERKKERGLLANNEKEILRNSFLGKWGKADR